MSCFERTSIILWKLLVKLDDVRRDILQANTTYLTCLFTSSHLVFASTKAKLQRSFSRQSAICSPRIEHQKPVRPEQRRRLIRKSARKWDGRGRVKTISWRTTSLKNLKPRRWVRQKRSRRDIINLKATTLTWTIIMISNSIRLSSLIPPLCRQKISSRSFWTE